MAGGDLKLVASKVGRLHLEKAKLSGSAREKAQKSRARQGGTGGIQQLMHAIIPKLKQHHIFHECVRI
jgi:hypothetical protein